MEKLIKCYSLHDFATKLLTYQEQGGRVSLDSVRQTGESTYIFIVEFADNVEIE
ncbi:MAG: hypothetical protein GOVbin4162_49 [Prokaryotic dsDNA virus sp.]|nr:MAG: hypothetical protein GOVbin4162_49 [Prokaryotic dsDNA virus sp.]